jgi:ADP-glucose pyrophosphorylase
MSRIIDFALSNAINSGIRRIGVATQYKAHSLIRHMNRAWNFMRPERNESFDILPASQRVSESQWYEGTADAVYQNIDIIEAHAPKYMVILAGDHIYKMDYELMLRQHVNSGADVTIGCLVVPTREASGFGVMGVDENDTITAFVEKPANPPKSPARPAGRWPAWASMSSTPASCSSCCTRMPPTRTAAAISAMTSSPKWSRAAKRWRIASLKAVCARPRRRVNTGAMWGH